MNKTLELLDLAAELYEGEERGRQLCPFCEGGSSGERTLSLKRDNRQVLYLCHRASCGAKGRVNIATQAAKGIREKRREFVTNPSSLPEEESVYLRDTFYLNSSEILRADLGWTTHYSPPSLGRIYIPMYRADRTQRGYAVRDFHKQQEPKSLIFLFRGEEPKLGWYRSHRKSLVIVEDAISALRASSYCNALYLSGTHISEDMVDEIYRVHRGDIYLMLDKDATKQALKLSLKHRHRLALQVVPLPKDIKNMARPELEEFFSTNTEIMNGIKTNQDRSG